MEIQVLGAHNSETLTSKYISLLVDDTLVIDAGGLTSSLTLNAQKKIKAILVTHKHFDHIKDIPSIAINLFFQGANTRLYSTRDTYEAIRNHLLNDVVYPDYFQIPEINPTLKYNAVEPGKIEQIENYSVLPVKMQHKEITVGYQITAKDNRSIFYSADTGKDLAHCWEQIAPQLLLIEVTFPNSKADFAVKSNHLTPDMLKGELTAFLRTKGYLPSVIAVHMKQDFEHEIEAELVEVAKHLNISIKLAHEDMHITI